MYIAYKQFYTFGETAEILGITRSSVVSLINRGLLEKTEVFDEDTGLVVMVVNDSALDDFMRNYPVTWKGLRCKRARPKKEQLTLTWVGENDEYYRDIFERVKGAYTDMKMSDEW